MNERIIKLYEQAQDEVVDSDCADYYERIQLKFAELIVGECVEICRSEEWEDQQGWGKFYAHQIKKHFEAK